MTLLIQSADYLGDFLLGDTIHFSFNTTDATGAMATLDGTPVISVYKNGSTTESTSGVTLTVDFDSKTGLHHVTINTSTDLTFYSIGSDFEVVIVTGTVSSISVVGTIVGHFSILNRKSAITERVSILGKLPDQSLATSNNVILPSVPSPGGILKGSHIRIYSGTGIHQERVITDSNNVTGQCIISHSWDVQPATGDYFAVLYDDSPKVFGIQTVAAFMDNISVVSLADNISGIISDITLDDQTGILPNQVLLGIGNYGANDIVIGAKVKVYYSSITARGQTRTIIAWDDTTGIATLDHDWIVQPIQDDQVTVSYGDGPKVDNSLAVTTNLLTQVMTEDYAADGAAMTPAQALYEICQLLEERSISGTTLTIKKRDGITTAFELTLDTVPPTTQTRSS